MPLINENSDMGNIQSLFFGINTNVIACSQFTDNQIINSIHRDIMNDPLFRLNSGKKICSVIFYIQHFSGLNRFIPSNHSGNILDEIRIKFTPVSKEMIPALKIDISSPVPRFSKIL